MHTETQPATIKAGAIGNGDQFTVLAGGVEKITMVDEFVLVGEGMPAMVVGSSDAQGTCYDGPLFSLC